MKCMSSIISKNDVFVVQLDIHICDSKWMLSGWVVFLLSNKEFFSPFVALKLDPIFLYLIQYELSNAKLS